MFRGVCILVLLALSAFANGAEIGRKLCNAFQKCSEEQKFYTKPTTDINKAMTSNPKMKCLVACVWREMGSVNEDNSFNVTQFLQDIPEGSVKTKITQVFNECSGEKDPDVCETAYKFYTCLKNKHEK